ncbi:N-acetyltransferase [Catenulispora pinisilvae]|uniref:N-acetyltransferase n=1 Tax=Catenulispora pinisilvae TaxID=2705253 RepID=UPI001891E6EA|nr:N-acetyltransferase [Catenulispora pinisilvae]
MIDMDFVELVAAGQQLTMAYEHILVPSFPADELCSIGDIAALASSGQHLVWVAAEPDGTVAAVAVGEWNPGPRVVLLSYIATRPGMRSGGVGGPLLDRALARWRDTFDPCVVLAEVEDPRHFTASEDHGDPVARLRFYTRRSARALDIPYFQAALGPGKQRVRNLLLMVLHAGPSFAGRGTDTLRGDFLRLYIELYQEACEGTVGTDPEALALFAAIDRPGGVPYLDFSAL